MKYRFFLLLIPFNFLFCEQFVRISKGPVSFESSRWSVDSKISFNPTDNANDLVDIAFPWYSNAFSNYIHEISLIFEDIGPYIKFDLGFSENAFGKEPKYFGLDGKLDGKHYGLGYLGLDLGFNLCFGVFDLARCSISPYFGFTRYRNGILISTYKSVIEQMKQKVSFLERPDEKRDLKNIAWDFTTAGVAFGINMSMFSIKADLFWMPYTKPEVTQFDIYKASMAASSEPPSASGLGYKLTAKLNAGALYIAFGSSYYNVGADIVLPKQYSKNDAKSEFLGFLSQENHGFFLSLGLSL